MSSPSDLSHNLSPLSHAAPHLQASTFTLISSDNVRFSVDAGFLSNVSNVFRDMLTSGSGELECEVTESAKELQARDIYWNWQFSYSVGVLLIDQKLAGKAAEASLEAFCSGSVVWTALTDLVRTCADHLTPMQTDYRDSHQRRVVACLNRIKLGKDCPECTSSEYRKTGKGDWENAVQQTKQKLEPDSNLDYLMTSELNLSVPPCERCRDWLAAKLAEFEKGRSGEWLPFTA